MSPALVRDTSAPGAVRRLGRFELRRVLGKGAQATVWLAHDPRLDREVAVKLLDPAADAGAVSEWLHEARAVSRLNHPHIVPVFEADQQALGGASQPYLVFEYVEGTTLSEALRSKGAMPARDAVALMLGVLDALAAAHAQGIVHRDLKPSNILLGRDGRARVMDFGIAARVTAGADGRIVGTAGYISPEAARGAAPVPAMDVFSVGVVLAEMLSGGRLLAETDPYRALERVQREDLVLPAAPAVDDVLRAIVQRALAREAQKRFDGAQALRSALADWLDPGSAAPVAAGHGTVDFLLRRMRNKGDFPALSESVVRIHRVANSETESLRSLSTEILKDVALTNKLLRMCNTPHFTSTVGNVNTISRAVALVGFAGIRNMALSLVLMEHMQDKAHAQQIKEEFLRALMAGTVAGELALNSRDGEEVFLGAMFQNLGRLLTEYYFPDEARQIRQSLPGPDTPSAARDAAAQRVLGIGFEELGLGIARSWGLPDGLQRCMRMPAADTVPRHAEGGVERQRWAGAAGNQFADAMLLCEGQALDQRLQEVAERYATVLAQTPRQLLGAAAKARERLLDLAAAMGLHAASGSPAHRLLSSPDTLGCRPSRPADGAKAPTLVLDGAGADAVPAKPPARERLSAGIQDITNSMAADNFRLNDVLRMVLQAILEGFDFQRVVFCLRDPKTEMLTGRFGLGAAPEALCRAFQVPLRTKGTADLLSAVCTKGLDTLIADATSGSLPSRLPVWYRDQVGAPTFLLLPLAMKGTPFALIYADKAAPGAIELEEADLALLRTLRNQAVMAFRQAGAG